MKLIHECIYLKSERKIFGGSVHDRCCSCGIMIVYSTELIGKEKPRKMLVENL